jgi:flagellar hook-associated protein 2
MVMRVGGLASGMNIDDIVRQLMTTHRAPVVKMTQKLQVLEWQREGLREINRMVLDFRNNVLFNLRLENNMKKLKADIDGDSSAVSATITGEAYKDATIHVEIVNRATAATKQSGVIVDKDNKVATLDTKLGDLKHFISDTTIKINDKDIDITDSMTIRDLIRKINQETTVSAYFDEASGKIAFQSKSTGASNGENESRHIEFEDANQFLEKSLNIDLTKYASEEGKDAEVIINGMSVTSSSNKFSINGVEITLKADSGTATVTVKTDVDSVVSQIKNFIDKYNELMQKLQQKLNEPVYRNFQPLTDEQRKEFKENGYDIDEWTSKAKSGILRNETILSRLQMQMRLAVSSSVDTGSGIDSLASIGIGFERFSLGSAKNGSMVILDETRLREAIENNVDEVFQLFTKEGSSFGSTGIIERLYNETKTALDDLTRKAGNPAATDDVTSLLGSQILNLGLAIDSKNEYLTRIENQYYAKFAVMERVIANYGSQSAYLSSVFGLN